MSQHEKPGLILVAAAILADTGSEPGKGTIWARALAKFYRLEIVTMPTYARELQRSGMPPGCRAHAAGDDVPTSPSAARYLLRYEHWCQQAIPVCRRIAREVPVAGLHHVTLGSFRVLPRYDRLGIPYTLGPLGGGEYIPWPLLPQLRLPPRQVLLEAARLPINYLFPLLPRLRAVLAAARLTLATTAQSAALLTTMGARNVAVVFPDAIDTGDDDGDVLRRREQQAAELPASGFRCVCAGRALWWKGIHLAIDFVHLLRGRGIDATLEIFSTGEILGDLRGRARNLGLEAHVAFPGMVSRKDLMTAYERCHLFVNPTMHDSASSALLEAYATGLPSMTLGLGGAATVTSSATGLNARVESIADWFDAGQRMVAGWLSDPRSWLGTCRAAKARSHDFGPAHPEACVREHLEPIFLPSTGRPPAV
jgi:glycosyltransferase involved in cell wall biosynthesis